MLPGAATKTTLRVAIAVSYRQGGEGDLAKFVDDALLQLEAGLAEPGSAPATTRRETVR